MPFSYRLKIYFAVSVESCMLLGDTFREMGSRINLIKNQNKEASILDGLQEGEHFFPI